MTAGQAGPTPTEDKKEYPACTKHAGYRTGVSKPNARTDYRRLDAAGIGVDSQHRYGATPDEWDTFAYVLGLTPDMLPVVSNPRAIISPGSDLKEAGKTPSQYNTAGHVAGLANWTKRVSTDRDVERWANQADLGFCVQTRCVRAIDVDVSDPILAAEIRREIVAFLGFEPPCRTRPNSSKFLFAITLPGEYTKRIIRTKQTTGEFDKAGNPRRHIVEFLAEGQQFIAAGTHPSGARYEWLPALPLGIPEVTPEQFEGLWFLLAELFGAESAELRKSTGALVARKAADAKDPLVDWLFDKWEVLTEDSRTGRLDITCPFEDEHSGESSKSATSYFPAGIGGYERGHFKCQHAHCANRTDAEFIAAIGDPVLDSFDIIEGEAVRLPADDSGIADLLGGVQAPTFLKGGTPYDDYTITPAEFTVHDKGINRGKIRAQLGNLLLALEKPSFSPLSVAFDTFDYQIKVARTGGKSLRPLRDADNAALRQVFECNRKGFEFEKIPCETMRDALRIVAHRHEMDSMQVWLDSLKWDGEARIADFLLRVFGCEDSIYHGAVGLYIWTALAGRIITPGEKVDMVPVFVGDQGLKKSTALSLIPPSTDFYTEIDLMERDADQARRMSGTVVCEIAELSGLHTRALEAIKAFLTRTDDKWVPKYCEQAVSVPRRCLLIGTTNEPEFLNDTTGNRRFLPVKVPGVSGLGNSGPTGDMGLDVGWLKANRDQLWAEGAALYRRQGVLYDVPERLAKKQHGEFRVHEGWEDDVRAWLHRPDADAEFEDLTAARRVTGSTPWDRKFLTVREVLRQALGFKQDTIRKPDEMRMARVMVALGYSKRRVMVAGEQAMRWTHA